jgi:hypothetical protein
MTWQPGDPLHPHPRDIQIPGVRQHVRPLFQLMPLYDTDACHCTDADSCRDWLRGIRTEDGGIES